MSELEPSNGSYIPYEPPIIEVPVSRDTPFEVLTEEQKMIRLAVDALYRKLRF